jgi:hypothetical protein
MGKISVSLHLKKKKKFFGGILKKIKFKLNKKIKN